MRRKGSASQEKCQKNLSISLVRQLFGGFGGSYCYSQQLREHVTTAVHLSIGHLAGGEYLTKVCFPHTATVWRLMLQTFSC